MRCTAHILNLIVQDGLKEITPIIQNIRDTLKFIKNSTTRIHKFHEMASELGLSSTRGLPIDVSTRWNSTYSMLECALIFREVFNSLGLEDSNYKNIPSEEEWEIASKICEFLKCFYEATLKFSRSKYLSIHLFLPEGIRIHSLLINTKVR